jgi:Rne/Rng family ribonuclease
MKLIMDGHELFSYIAFIDNNEIKEFMIEKTNQLRRGDIYMGKISKIENNTVFVNFGNNYKDGFLSIFSIHPDYFHIKDKSFLYREDRYDIYKNINLHETLHLGQRVLVQVIREEHQDKGVMLSTFLSFKTKYFKYIHNSINKKLLMSNYIFKDIVKKYFNLLPGSIVLREDFQIESISDLEYDLQELLNVHKILNNFKENPVYVSDDVFISALKNPLIHLTSKIYCNKFCINKVTNLVNYYGYSIPIVRNDDYLDILDDLLKSEVKLKSGGYLLITNTDGGTTIDVNSGNSKNLYQTNKEAAYEIIQHIKLRNISGLIFIDFLKLSTEEYLKIDKILIGGFVNNNKKIQIIPINDFGVSQICIQNTTKSLNELLMEKVSWLNGYIKTTDCLHYQLDKRSNNRKQIITNSILANQINKKPHSYSIHLSNNLSDVFFTS